jgi:hypothetical protein
LDQITEHLAFQRSLAKAKASNMQAQLPAAIHPHLIEQAASVIRQFSATSIPKQAGKVPLSEIYFIGALHGFFSTVAPMLQIEVNKNPNESVSISAPSLRADLLLSRQGQRVIIEVKRNIRSFDKDVIDQMERYMQFFGTKEAILFIAPKENGDLVRQDIEVPTLGGRIIVLAITPRPAASRRGRVGGGERSCRSKRGACFASARRCRKRREQRVRGSGRPVSPT